MMKRKRREKETTEKIAKGERDRGIDSRREKETKEKIAKGERDRGKDSEGRKRQWRIKGGLLTFIDCF